MPRTKLLDARVLGRVHLAGDTVKFRDCSQPAPQRGDRVCSAEGRQIRSDCVRVRWQRATRPFLAPMAKMVPVRCVSPSRVFGNGVERRTLSLGEEILNRKIDLPVQGFRNLPRIHGTSPFVQSLFV